MTILILKKKMWLSRSLPSAAFGFGGQGQNMGLAFVVLNDWDERKSDQDKSPCYCRSC